MLNFNFLNETFTNGSNHSISIYVPLALIVCTYVLIVCNSTGLWALFLAVLLFHIGSYLMLLVTNFTGFSYMLVCVAIISILSMLTWMIVNVRISEPTISNDYNSHLVVILIMSPITLALMLIAFTQYTFGSIGIDVDIIILLCIPFIISVWILFQDRMEIGYVMDTAEDLAARQKAYQLPRRTVIDLVSRQGTSNNMYDRNDPTGSRLLSIFGTKYRTDTIDGSVSILLTHRSNKSRTPNAGLVAVAFKVDVEQSGCTIMSKGLPVTALNSSSSPSSGITTFYVDF